MNFRFRDPWATKTLSNTHIDIWIYRYTDITMIWKT